MAQGWGDENVTNRADNCDPIFIPYFFYDLKISQLKNAGNKNGISFFRVLETFSSLFRPRQFGCESQRMFPGFSHE
ncbi:Uncharacterized protein dnm_080550 [Desulfonema magnum]|uniref:Uncharacterized protein n=1 Tax=Desulfonema magnum TaxID=45655 RepID=A0A975BUY7_9BACT|nr:Uncharacterized protein dnm_080550 [Desulfonema magnum]